MAAPLAKAAAARPARRLYGIAVGCMLASGAAALVYEVVWLRLLSLVMGSTAYALATMLSAFLGGLALGAFLGGRATERRGASLRAYAALEAGIALLAGAMPVAIAMADPLFGAAYRALGENLLAYSLAQLAIAGTLLLLPTTLMGATLPCLVAVVVRETRDLAPRVGALYAANSFGAAAGGALAGFALLPTLGMRATTAIAVATNLAVALVAFLAHRAHPDAAASAASGTREGGPEVGRRVGRGSGDPRGGPPPARRPSALAADLPAPGSGVIATLYGISGFATLALQVAWARIVSLSIGSTAYGFTITLVTFIVGIALGSLLAARSGLLARRPVRAIAALHVVLGLSAALSVGWLGALPARVVALVGDARLDFGALLVRELALVGATILVPTLAMGALFPLVTGLWQRGAAGAGRAVGSVYAANTWGNILGSFSAGFVLVPWLGMRATLLVAAVLSTLVGVAYLAPAIRGGRRDALAGAGLALALVALAALLAPGWDRELVTSGPYLYGRSFAARLPPDFDAADVAAAARAAFGELVDYREGASGVASVRRRGERVMLQVGGKGDAYSFASSQNLIAHLPLLLHGSARDVLVIGLGGGTTLASALAHPVERVEVVEISAEVRDLARRWFAPWSGAALADPRAHVRIGDGRNHLRHAGRNWDVIVSQPSNPWISGSAALFTRDFFEDVARRLRPGGIACLWFKPTDEDGGYALRSVLRAFAAAFPRPFLFESRVLGEFILIGTLADAPFSGAALARALAEPRIAEDLARLAPFDAPDAAGMLLLGPDAVRGFAGDAEPNTDDNALVEFLGPSLVLGADRLRAQEALEAARSHPLDYFAERIDSADPFAQAFAARVDAIRRSKSLVLEARRVELRAGRGSAEWREAALRAAALNPADPYVGPVLRASRPPAPVRTDSRRTDSSSSSR